VTKTVSFHRMQDGTRDDYLLLDQQEREFARTLPDRIVTALRSRSSMISGTSLHPITTPRSRRVSSGRTYVRR
jgi:hypothetical protein